VSMLTSLAKVAAYEQGRAVRLASFRHVHLSARPLMFLPLSMAGEANAPLACLIGDEPDFPRLLVVPQPRNRDLRFGFANQLAPTALNYVYGFTAQLDPTHRSSSSPIRAGSSSPGCSAGRCGSGVRTATGRCTRACRSSADG